MSNETPLSVTVDELRRGLRVFRAFEQAEATITALQGAEQRVTDTQRLIETLQAKLAEVNEELFDANSALTQSKATCSEMLANTKSEAEAILANAKADAADIAAKAKAKADERLDNAEDKARDAEARAGEAEKRRDAATKALAEIESKLETAKTQIAKLLG